METIHVKTVDPISQDLLRYAARKGIKLNWERYENLQPQDGFLRVGLSCPFGCLQGPCRIDPFGRGPDRGLCGLDRDAMVAALLLRLSLQGALEAMSDVSMPDNISEISWPLPLKDMVGRACENLGGNSFSTAEIYSSAFLLQRPTESPKSLILQAMRLGVLTLGLLEMGRQTVEDTTGSLPCKAGYGLLAGSDVIVGVCGQVPQERLKDLFDEDGVKIVSLGDWIRLKDSFLPCVCTSGETELVLSSGRIDLLIFGPGGDPSLPELCRELNVPVASTQEAHDTEKIMHLARRHSGGDYWKNSDLSIALVKEGAVITAQKVLESRFARDKKTRLAILGGSDTLQQSLGLIPMELASVLQGKGCAVAGWGDAALWMIKGGSASEEQAHPALILDNQQGPLIALKALASSGKMRNLQGICFTGLKSCKDMAVALGLASLGINVCVAVPIPLWGSEKVRALLADKFKALGGELTHFDHPAGKQEILEWFLKN